MKDPLSIKQVQFIQESMDTRAKWIFAHGSVRTGKTVCSLFLFMLMAEKCPDSQIFMVGHTSETIYDNAIKLLFESPQFLIFKPFCTWSPGNRVLTFRDKKIKILGAKDEGSIGAFQGKTFSLVYCDEMTLYPDSIIDMIDSRLSNPWSKGIATMNPTYPDHKIKKWIDMGLEGDKNYYSLHFTLEDNPFVDDDYKNRLKFSTTGVFHKRNYLGLWCMAEGAIFDFFDKDIHVSKRVPAADYWIAGVDFGISNSFACVVVGVCTGQYPPHKRKMWVESEYVWDSAKQGRQKLVSELADGMTEFLQPYALRGIYVDPSAAALKVELNRKGINTINAYNEVVDGIHIMTDMMNRGDLCVFPECKNLIREIQNYVWDTRKAKEGEDAPVKKADHAIDALRYACATHKLADPKHMQSNHNPEDYKRNRFDPTRR